MAENATSVLFFDLGDTLGTPRISPPPSHLIGFIVYPYAKEVLSRLHGQGYRLGIISNTGDDDGDAVDAVLEQSGLLSFFEPQLRIYSRDVGLLKNSPDIFRLSATRAGVSPESCVFVGEDSVERRYAAEAGLRVCPHPLLLDGVLRGEWLRYARISVPPGMPAADWQRLRGLEIVPLHAPGEQMSVLYALATQTAVTAMADFQLTVIPLGRENAPLFTELYLLRDDRAARTGFMAPDGQAARFGGASDEAGQLLAALPDGLLVAVPADRSVEQYHFEEAFHGHNLKLVPDPTLLQPSGADRAERGIDQLAAEPDLDDEECRRLSSISAGTIRRHVTRYAGTSPLGDDDEGKIVSRHIHNADNGRATLMLARDLEKIGSGDCTVELHAFTHEGRRLHNVVADFAGGETEELVLVTAHLDSTAAFSWPYNPAVDPAPGADDDASGVAAVLAIAETLRTLIEFRRPKRRFRFVLFNAEEHGLVGSKAYARSQAAISAPIVAVYQIDMGVIGYNRAPPRSWEMHAGYWPSADVQERSRVLAERVGRIAARVSPELPKPQVYVSTGPGGNRDPAENRSDHAAFQERGYAACVATEDFFAGPHPDSPVPEGNPEYHRKTDTFVDEAYAADIARAIAGAAWITANL